MFPAIGLLLALCAAAVSARAWLGERALAAGRSAQARRDHAGAVSAYGEAAALGSAEAAVEGARLLVLRGDAAGAEAALRTAQALSPSRGLPHLLRAQLEATRPGPWDGPREDRVLGACRTAVALEPARAAIWRDCAAVALELLTRRRPAWGEERIRAVRDGAAQDCVEAIALRPAAAGQTLQAMLAAGADPPFLVEAASAAGIHGPLAAAAEVLMDSGLWPGAEREFWAVGERRGRLALHAAALADVLTRRKLPAEALAAARRGLLSSPGDGVLAARAADLTARLRGEAALEAIPLYRAALAADPGNAALRTRFARFLAGRALVTEAESEARAAVAAEPRAAEAWFLLGDLLRRRGRTGEAREAFGKAARLRPGREEYRRAAADPQLSD